MESVVTLKRILNTQEEIVDTRLQSVCAGFGARAHTKVRVADVLQIDGSELSPEDFSYALRAHFDFVVVNENQMPLFAVEYDGPTHDSERQQRRDKIKNRLAERFSLPLLRVRSAHLERQYDGWDLLSWIVEVWFLWEEADELQQQGALPDDYYFDPSLIVTPRQEGGLSFPYWLGIEAQTALRDMCKRGEIRDPYTVEYQGADGGAVRRGFSYIQVDANNGVRATAAMREQLMRVDLAELMRAVLLKELIAELAAAKLDPEVLQPMSVIHDEFAEFRDRYPMLCYSGYHEPNE